MTSKAFICVLSGLFIFALVQTTQAISISGCENMTSGFYELTSDVINHNGLCMDITGSNVILDCDWHVIDGLDDGIGIYVHDGANFTVQNCIIRGYEEPIRIDTTINTSLLGNDIDLNETTTVIGIGFYNSSDSLISDNTILVSSTLGNVYGILEESKVNRSNNIIKDNSLQIIGNQAYGIKMGSYNVDANATNITIDNNTVVVIGINDDAIAFAVGETANDIIATNIRIINNNATVTGYRYDDDSFTQVSAVYMNPDGVYTNPNNLVENNTFKVFSNGRSNSIYFLSMDNSMISNNTINVTAEDTFVIYLATTSSGIWIKDNTVIAILNESDLSSYAVSIPSGVFNVSGNTIIATGFENYGLCTVSSSNNRYWDNIVSGETAGLFLYGNSDGNVYTNNTVSGTHSAVVLYGYPSNLPDNNIFANSTYSGGSVDVNLTSGGGNGNRFRNCTYDTEDITTGQLYREWYVKANVTVLSTGAPISGADVTFEDADSLSVRYNYSTGPDGLTVAFPAVQYLNTSLGITYWTNYTVNGSKVGYYMATQSENLTTNRVHTINITMEPLGDLTITWDWNDINTTIQSNSTVVAVIVNRASNCTLHFNGTDYANTTVTAFPTWSFDNLSNGMYDHINVTCDDTHGYSNISTDGWLNVYHLAPGVFHRYAWKVRCYLNSTTYNESMVSYVGVSEALNVELGSTDDEGPSEYTMNDTEVNTTQTQEYLSLMSFDDVDLPLWGVAFNITAYDAYNFAYMRYVLTFYDGSIETQSVHTNGTVDNVTEQFNLTFGKYWFDVDNLDLQMKSLDGGNVSIHNVTVYQTGSLGFTEPFQYLVTRTTQELVGPINQTNDTQAYNLSPTQSGYWDIWAEVNETLDCVTHFMVSNGTYIYDNSVYSKPRAYEITDFPNRIYSNLSTPEAPLKMWTFSNFFECDPGNLTTYNWQFHFILGTQTGW